MTRAFETRLRKLEARSRPEGEVFFLAWGSDEAEASQRASLAHISGEIGRGDVVVIASWPDGAGVMPASRWVGRIDPAEFDLLARAAERLAGTGGEGASQTARWSAMSDAQLVAAALGVAFERGLAGQSLKGSSS